VLKGTWGDDAMHEHLSVEFVDVAMMAEDSVAKEEADRISGMAFEGAAHSRSGNSVTKSEGILGA
jgi:hypothetical protein